jgi:hypothetical protein
MALDIQPKYPSRRTYVLKLRSDATPHRLAGVLENLVTGEQHEFSSGGELMDVLEFELNVSLLDHPEGG